jgi:long-chain acyl-CoA synthetase
MLERLLARQEDPTQVAVVAGNIRLTYRALSFRVSAFAARLRRSELRDGDCILVVLGNGIEFIVALFAAAKLNCAVFAVDPSMGHAAIAAAARQSSAKIAVIRQSQFQLCAGLPLVAMDPTDEIEVEAIQEELVETAELDDGEAPFLIQYSSGITGIGKRIGRTQKNLIAEAQNFTAAARVQADDKIVCAVPLFHAHGMGNCLMAAFYSGATLVLAEALGAPTENILSLIEREGITIFPGVPFIFDALAAAPDELCPNLASVRLCFSAGNFLSYKTFSRFLTRYGIPIRQLYGCTEAGSVSLNLDHDPTATWNSVGLPLGTARVEIFDSEIAVRSPALTSGYLDVPQLNREAFRDGWFFTGDLGKRDDQGRLYIVGRKHVIVDVGGRKVDPQEVEEVILQHAAVAEAVVVGVNLGPSKAFLKAVIVTQYPCSSAEIADHCKERLAAFKCPSAIEFVDALPKTALGKIKRGDLIKSDVPAAIGPSLPAIERFLRLELSGLLKRDADAIGSSQLIMEQGITSAQAVQLAARIQSRMAIPVPATLVWNYPTIASITRWIMDRMAESPSRRLFGTQTLSEASIEGTRILGERGQLI